MGLAITRRNSHASRGSGQSLIEVLVAAGAASILMMGFAAMQTSQAKQTKAMTEQLGRLELQNLMMNALGDGTMCSALLADGAHTFNSTLVTGGATTNITPAPTTISASTTAGAPVLAQVSGHPSPLANSLQVSDIQVAVTEGSGTSYRGQFKISFDNTKTVRPVGPVIVQTMLTVDPTVPTAAKIVGCGTGVATHGTQAFTYTGADQTWTVPAGISVVTVKAWGAGGGSPGDAAQTIKAGTGRGGGGAYATKVVGVAAGDVLTIKVGGGGGVGIPGPAPPNYTGTGGWPNGGNGGQSGFHPGTGGAGGGSSSVIKAGAVQVEAGGGGGGWWCAESTNVGYGIYGGGVGQGASGACGTPGVQPGESPIWGGCGGIGGGGGGYCGGSAVLGSGVDYGGFSFGTTMVSGSGTSAGNGAEMPCNGSCGNAGGPNAAGQNGVVYLSW